MLNTIKMLMILLIFTLLVPFGSTLSYAWEHGGGGYHGGGYHGYGGRGYGNFGIGFNYSPYYYNPGYYYPYYPDYYDTGVILSSSVVETPEIIEQPAATVVTTAPDYPTTEITPAQTTTTTDTDNEITINIPNAAGGYTSVLMKRSGKGFVGPQGEFYPEFPKVSVLKAIYVK